MSKSRGNVVNPDEIVETYGADTMRLYEMFIGDFEKTAPWSSSSIKGCKRFLDRTWGLMDILTEGDTMSEELVREFHRTIKKVSEDIETMGFNTAIAALMALINKIYQKGAINKAELRVFLTLLNPFAPHITEEMWQLCGFEGMVAETSWPIHDEALCKDSEIEIAVQINGKLRGRIKVAEETTQEEAVALAMADEKISAELSGKNIVKQIYVKGKILNIVAK